MLSIHSVARGPVPRERWGDRTMARDRPSPYDKRSCSGYRSAGACPPRSLGAGSSARDRPSRYGTAGGIRLTMACLALRCGGRCPFSVVRGPVPRDRFRPRSAGACPPRSLGAGSIARDRPSRYGAKGGVRLTRACLTLRCGGRCAFNDGLPRATMRRAASV